MADDVLRSNILIASKLTVEKKGFTSVHATLSNIVLRLKEISSKPYEIKINVDDSKIASLEKMAAAVDKISASLTAMKTAGINLNKVISGSVKASAVASAAAAASAASTSTPTPLSPNATKFDIGRSGMSSSKYAYNKKSKQVELISRMIARNQQTEITGTSETARGTAKVYSPAGKLLGKTETERVTDLQEKERLRQERIAAVRQQKLDYERSQDMQRQAAAQRAVKGLGFLGFRQEGKVATTEKDYGKSGKQEFVTAANYVRTRKNGVRETVKINELSEKTARLYEVINAKVTKQQEIKANIAAAIKEENKLIAKGYKTSIYTNQEKRNTHGIDYFVKTFTKDMKNGNEVVIKGDQAQNTWTSSIRRTAEAIAAEKKALKDANAEMRAREKLDRKIANDYRKTEGQRRFVQRADTVMDPMLRRAGYSRGGTSTLEDAASGRGGEIREYYKIAREGLAKYRVELTRVNTLTQKVTTETLTGARAAKYLGDSFRHVTEKVLMWTGATSVVFGLVQALKTLGRTAIELEANTVFMARVGKGLVPEGEKDPTQRMLAQMNAAKRLTGGIIELTMAIGGSATEAQQAAAVFLRMGQTEEQALKSVKAALIAAKVAELEVMDAAVLLSAAMLQFNINADDLLPTLDSLNTLSNNYRVSTDDLLQSISRAGSVVAEHNGRLTELAAVTAIVAERTARSGTQIGNAFKTIQSRLDTLDVRKMLAFDTGILMHDAAGEVKTLTTALLELELALKGMSDAEKKEITLQVAGMRQRNMLDAALKDSIEIIEAENMALTQHGSAITEAVMTSYTMESGLQRMRASFMAMANTVNGPAGSALRGMIAGLIGLIDAIIRVDNAFGGFFSKTTAFLGISAGLFYIFKTLSPAVVALSAVVRGLGTSLTVTTAKTNSLTAAQIAYGASAKTAAASATVLKFATADVISLVASLAIMATAWSFSAQASELQGIKSLRETNLEIADRELTYAEKQLEATKNTAKAYMTLILAKENALSSGKPDIDIEEKAARLGKSLGLDISGKSTEESLRLWTQKQTEQVKEVRSAELIKRNAALDTVEGLKRENKELEAQYLIYLKIKLARDALQNAGYTGITDQELQKLIYRAANMHPSMTPVTEYDKKAAIVRGIDIGRGTARIPDIGRAAENSEKYTKNLADVKKLLQEIGEIESKVSTQDNFIVQLQDNSAFNATFRSMVQVTAELEKMSWVLEDMQKFESVIGFKSFKSAADDIEHLEAKIFDLDKLITELERGGREVELADESKKLMFKMSDEAKERRIRRMEAQFRDRSAYYSEQRSSDYDLRSSLAAATMAQERGLADAPSQMDSLSDLGLKRSLLAEDVALAKKRLEAIGSEPAPTTDEQSYDRAARAKSESLHISEQLALAGKTELDYAIKLHETEVQIALERKKSADEAARALGTLSEEDKLRVRAQAAFFAANPNYKVSVQEQFLGSSEGNRIGQGFYAGHMETMTEAMKRTGVQQKAAGGRLLGTGQVPILAHGGELIIPKENVDRGIMGVIEFAKKHGLVFQEGGVVPKATLDTGIAEYQRAIAANKKLLEKEIASPSAVFGESAQTIKLKRVIPLQQAALDRLIAAKAAQSTQQPAGGFSQGVQDFYGMTGKQQPAGPFGRGDAAMQRREKNRLAVERIQKSRKKEAAPTAMRGQDSQPQSAIDSLISSGFRPANPDPDKLFVGSKKEPWQVDLEDMRSRSLAKRISDAEAAKATKVKKPDLSFAEIRAKSRKRNADIDRKFADGTPDMTGARSPLLTGRADYYNQRYGSKYATAFDDKKERFATSYDFGRDLEFDYKQSGFDRQEQITGLRDIAINAGQMNASTADTKRRDLTARQAQTRQSAKRTQEQLNELARMKIQAKYARIALSSGKLDPESVGELRYLLDSGRGTGGNFEELKVKSDQISTILDKGKRDAEDKRNLDYNGSQQLARNRDRTRGYRGKPIYKEQPWNFFGPETSTKSKPSSPDDFWGDYLSPEAVAGRKFKSSQPITEVAGGPSTASTANIPGMQPAAQTALPGMQPQIGGAGDPLRQKMLGEEGFYQQLGKSGFGSTPELNKAQQQITQAKGGLSTDEIARNARIANAEMQRQAGIQGGKQTTGISMNIGEGNTSSGMPDKLLGGFKVQPMNTDKMVEGIERIVNTAMKESEVRFMAAINALEQRIKTKRPTKVSG